MGYRCYRSENGVFDLVAQYRRNTLDRSFEDLREMQIPSIHSGIFEFSLPVIRALWDAPASALVQPIFHSLFKKFYE
jgi:hypothetical protein